MTTPTGYKFLYNGVETDFADVFDISNPVPGIKTGYTSTAYEGRDLGEIFTSGNTNIQTFYYDPNNTDLGTIFAQPVSFTTNGTVSYTNPFVTSAPTTGYTYILFDSTTTSYYFNNNTIIPRLYYMIVGTGGTGQSCNSAVPGAGGGAGGCYNFYYDNFSIGNYNITIPTLSLTLYTQITNGSTFTLKAQTGTFVQRGCVNLNGTDLVPASLTQNEQGVGGSGGEAVGSGPGGSVYTNPGNSGNYLTFLGDGLVSNTYFGGGGGSGASYNVSNPTSTANGGNGGGGGGGAGSIPSTVSDPIIYGDGGIGTNGNNGENFSSTTGTKGGNAFNSIGQGFGGGGGGGGSSGRLPGDGGIGGGAILLLYF